MAKKKDKEQPAGESFRLLAEKSELVPISQLKLHPRNPNSGDVGRIADSVEVNGFYGGLVVQRSTGYILVGNHRYQAAVQAGAEALPVFYVDVSDEEALRLILNDNALGKLAVLDTPAVSRLLEELDEQLGSIDGTGYTHAEWAEMAAKEARKEAKEAATAALGVEVLDEPFELMPARVLDSNSKWWKARRKAWETFFATRPKADRIAAGPDELDAVAIEAAVRWFSPPGGRVLSALGGMVRKFVTMRLQREYASESAPEETVDMVIAVGPPAGDGMARIVRAAELLADDRFLVVVISRITQVAEVSKFLDDKVFTLWELFAINKEVKNADIRPFDVSRQAIENVTYLAVYVKGDPVAAAAGVGAVEYGFPD